MEKTLIMINLNSNEHKMSFSKIETENGKHVYSVHEPSLSENEKETFLDALSRVREKLTEKDAKGNLENSYHKINSLLKKVAKKRGRDLTSTEEIKVTYLLYRDLIGLGLVESLYADPDVRYISCRGLGSPIHINHEKHGLIKTNIVYKSKSGLGSTIWRLLHKCEKLDSEGIRGILPDGSFVESNHDLAFSIRRPSFEFGPEYLMKSKTLTPGALAYVHMMLKKKNSIFLVGPENSGKTNLASGLLTLLPEKTKVSIIEDRPNFSISDVEWSSHVAPLEKNNKMKILYEESRQNPDYFVFDELDPKSVNYVFQYISICPGIVIMQAKNTDSAISKLTSEPINIPKSTLANFDVVISLNHKRKVQEILELLRHEEDTNELVAKIAFVSDREGKLKPGESRFLRSLTEKERAELEKKTKEFMELK